MNYNNLLTNQRYKMQNREIVSLEKTGIENQNSLIINH